MRKIYTSVSALIISALVAVPAMDAQSRGRSVYGGGTRTERPASQRPGGNTPQRPGGNTPQRPGGNTPQRPGGNTPQRPGGNTPQRPGGNTPQRPGGNTPQRPGGNGPQRPGGGYTPGHGPGGNHGHHRPGTPPPPRPGGGHHHGGYRPGPPPRPHMPAHRPWRPPVPPPNFRPYYGAPSFTGILGLTFGTALGITLSNLANTGYNVTGYGNDCIYLSNVPMFNLSWPNATLNYVNGNLRGSEFTYSTPGYDMSRYNMLYNSLVAQYGYPVSVQNNGGYNVSATWWGYNNGYITLSYFSDYAYNGTMRYYTTLSIGN